MSWQERLRQTFSPHGFRGPVLTLLSGTTVTFVLVFLTQPILTRLYTPEDFGVSDYFITLLTLLIALASLRYEDAVMLPESDEEAAGVMGLSVVLMALFVVGLALLVPWSRPIAAALGVPAAAPYLWLVPPTLLMMRLAKLAEVWYTRRRLFRRISAAEVANKSVLVGARVGAGVATDLGAGGLIGGFLLSHVASAAYYGRHLLGKGRRHLRGAFAPERLRTVAVRYRRFPLYSTPSTLLGAAVARLPILMLPFFFGLEVVGLFGRAFIALAVPLSLIGGAVASVFFVQAAEAHRGGALSRLSAGVHARLVMIGLFPMLVLVLAGPDLFEVVFGAEWRTAGSYERYVGPWLFLASVASPLTRLFDVLERQRLDLLMSLAMFAGLGAALFVGGRTGDAEQALLYAGAAGAVVRTGQIVVLLRLVGVTARQALRPYVRYALMGLPGLLALAAATSFGRPWLTTAAAIGAGIAYATLVAWRDQLFTRPPDHSV